MRLWYMKNHLAADAATTDNIITLSDQFWNEIREHPIPADLNTVRALVNAPGCLDLYLWLVWRCFKLKRDAQIPLFGAYGLCHGTSRNVGAGESFTGSEPRRPGPHWCSQFS